MELQKPNYELSKPLEAMAVAETLQKFVREKRLTANIQGKEYPLVEAWQFAGSQLGLYPVVINVQNISTPEEYKYQASVEVRRFSDDKVVGFGFAICSNKEKTKRYFDEYAICSMAQTRATGKAFRNLLAWLMKAAGFEATPAEEMDFKTQDMSDVPDETERNLLRQLVYNSDLTNEEREAAFLRIETLTNYKDYERIQHRLEQRQVEMDQVANPSQTDIKKAVNGKLKRENT